MADTDDCNELSVVDAFKSESFTVWIFCSIPEDEDWIVFKLVEARDILWLYSLFIIPKVEVETEESPKFWM